MPSPASRPKLITSNAGQPVGSVTTILTNALEPAKGERAELGEVYKARRKMPSPQCSRAIAR
jgi:hypothetical protein